MAYDPSIRVSDADRDRAASLLREHLAAGRLTPEEFSERLDQAYGARTTGDIDALLKDLPGIDLYRLPDAALTRVPRQQQPRPRQGRRGHSGAWRLAWGLWLAVVVICFVVWGAAGSVWPLWGAAAWGALMAGGQITDRALEGWSDRRSLPRGGQGRLPRGDEDLPGRR